MVIPKLARVRVTNLDEITSITEGHVFFFYRKIVLLGDIKSKPINPAGVTYGGLRGAYQA